MRCATDTVGSVLIVAGSVDSGKSSLVGVLTHGVDGRPLLDNGCGSARMNVFQHKHEIETGRTSSLTHQMLGYDEEGQHHCDPAVFAQMLVMQHCWHCCLHNMGSRLWGCSATVGTGCNACC